MEMNSDDLGDTASVIAWLILHAPRNPKSPALDRLIDQACERFGAEATDKAIKLIREHAK